MSYLGLPLHSCHGDTQEKDHCDGADDSDVIDLIGHEGICALRDNARIVRWVRTGIRLSMREVQTEDIRKRHAHLH